MTDWLARNKGGVLDLRLPGDPPHIPRDLAYRRIAEYYAQLRGHVCPTADITEEADPLEL